jgi:hypothetical protein
MRAVTYIVALGALAAAATHAANDEYARIPAPETEE